MGPGVYQHPTTHKVHIRLTHTTHVNAGVTDYTGKTNPRYVGLAICTDAVPTVKIENCDGTVLRGLRIRGGGGTALAIGQSSLTVVDHVTLLGGPDVLLVHDASSRTRLSHCVIDGGLPPWVFRSDLKSYYTVDATGVVNVLGKQTVDSLLRCGRDIHRLVLDHCELVNSHDMLLAGTDVELDHTQLKYPPGVEDHGGEADRGFAAMQPWPLDQHARPIDDFRLTRTSPARNHGAPLPGDLADQDPDPADGVRDIGCFEYGAAPLAVGVGGRRPSGS